MSTVPTPPADPADPTDLPDASTPPPAPSARPSPPVPGPPAPRPPPAASVPVVDEAIDAALSDLLGAPPDDLDAQIQAAQRVHETLVARLSEAGDR